MKTWTPLLTSAAIAVLVNLIPLVMAFVLKLDGAAESAWVYYIFTVPVGILLMLIGLLISLLLYFKRN